MESASTCPDQDNAPADVFGVDATVVRQLKNLITLEVETFNYVFGMKIPQPKRRVECEVGDVVEVSGEEVDPKSMKSINSMSNAEKRFCIKQAWGNAVGYAVIATPGTMLSDEDLTLISEYLQWQYMMPEIQVMNAAGIKVVAHFGLTSPEGALVLQELRDALKIKKVVVCPIHCEAAMHWTFLVLMADEAGKVLDVEYWDWLTNVESNAGIAQQLLTMLTLDHTVPSGHAAAAMKLPAARNLYRQRHGSNDCGFALWQVMETHMKRQRLECDIGVLPKPVEWRKLLNTFETNLCNEQSKWDMETAQGLKPKFVISIPGHKKTGSEWNFLKMHRKEFFSCSSCRWSQSGDGCCYCNPAKHAKLSEEKNKSGRQLAEALKKAVESCQKLGLLPALMEPAAPSAPSGGMKGGGDHCK